MYLAKTAAHCYMVAICNICMIKNLIVGHISLKSHRECGFYTLYTVQCTQVKLSKYTNKKVDQGYDDYCP